MFVLSRKRNHSERVKWRMPFVFVLFLLSCASNPKRIAPPETPVGATQPDNTLDRYLTALTNHNYMQGSFIITRGGQPLFERAYGSLDAEGLYKANTESTYRIGSISKTLTATMILQLVDEGKLSLETTIERWFPSVPNAESLTIDLLLRHRSGLYNIYADTDEAWLYAPISREELIEKIVFYGSYSDPNTERDYNNSNYMLLGYLIESLDQQSLNDSLQQRISDKIGAVRTETGQPIQVDQNEAKSLDYLNDWVETEHVNLTTCGGAGGFVSHPRDICRFANKLFNGDLLSESSLTYMKEMEAGLFSDDNTYYGHAGGMDEFRSNMLYRPADQTCLAYTTNAYFYKRDALVSVLKKASDGELIVVPTFEKIELTQEQLAVYSGVYKSSERPSHLILQPGEGVLLIQESESTTFEEDDDHAPLMTEADGVFAFYPYALEIDFSDNGQGPKDQFIFRLGEDVFRYTRFQPNNQKTTAPNETK